MTSVSELGWLAGIADGEGSFFLTLTWATGRNFPQIKMSFAVGNTNEEIIKGLKRILSGLVGREKRYLPIKKKDGCKQSWLIALTSFEDLKIFCEAVLPYLEGKKRQAQTMLDFIELGTATKGLKRFDVGIRTQDVAMFERRKLLVAKMKWLNQHPGKDYSLPPANDLTGSPLDEVEEKSDLHGDMQSAAEMVAPL